MHHNNTRTMLTLPNIGSLNTAGAGPRYEQIANAFCEAIRRGQLKPGDRLPTIRQLAADLGVSLTTVMAAFKSLAEDGWTRGEIGRGTFVADRPSSSDSASLPFVPSVATSTRRWPGV